MYNRGNPSITMNYANEITRSLSTIREMLTDRGLDASDLDNLGDNEITNLVRERARFFVECNKCSTAILFDVSAKLTWKDTMKTYDEYVDRIEGEKQLLIIVVRDSSELKKSKQDVNHDNYQIFDLEELQFNKSHHHLVFKHELVTDYKEYQNILVNYQLKSLTQLPIILKMDPQAKYLNAKPGQVVRVYRISPTSGTNIVYRYVT